MTNYEERDEWVYKKECLKKKPVISEKNIIIVPLCATLHIIMSIMFNVWETMSIF